MNMRAVRIVFWTGLLAWSCAAGADLFDRFPGIKQRSYAFPADGTATIYRVADNRAPELSTITVWDGGILGLSQDGLFGSADGGLTWTVWAVDPQGYFAGASGSVYARTTRGLYRTQGNGSSWKAVQLPGDVTYYPFTGTVDGARVYAAVNDGLYVTADDGWAWRKLANTGQIRQLAVSGKSIAFYRPTTSGGFLSTTLEEELRFSGDEGETWTNIDPPRGGLSSLAVLDDALYAIVGTRVMRWRAGAWTTLTPEGREIQKLAVSDAALYASGVAGILRSVDGGRSWTAATLPPLNPGERLESISCAGRDALATAKALSAATLYVSRDGGLQWNRLPAAPVPDVLASSLSGGAVFIRTRDGGYVYDVAAKSGWRRLVRQLPSFGYQSGRFANGRSLGLVVGNAFFRSSDQGQTWDEVSSGTTRFDRLDPAAGVLLAVSGRTIMTSADDGRTWDELPAPGHGDVQLLRKFGGTLYAVERSYANNQSTWHLWRHPEGSTWRELAETADFPIIDVIVDGPELYAHTGSTLLRMTPSGDWESLLRGPLIDARPSAVHVNTRGVLFIASSKGFFWSNDRGANWRRASGELLPNDQNITTIAQYAADGLLLLSFGRLYLCADLTSWASPGSRSTASEPRLQESRTDQGIALPVKPAAGAMTVTLDGREVPANSLVRDEAGLTLRTDSSAWQAVPDGVTGVEVQLREPKGNTLRQKFFLLKEQTRALLFKPYARSLAVLIAISKYGDASYPNLPSASAQARELEAILQRQGFEVTRLEDVTRARIEKYLFEELAPRLGPNDRLLLYFAGHGDTESDVLGNQVGYFIPSGARKSTLAIDALPLSRIEQEYARLLKAKHVLFVIDACFSGLVITREPSRDPETLIEIRSLTEARSRAVLAAGRAGDAALDVNGGIFTRAFINGIKGGADHNRNGVVTLQELFDEVRRVVMADARSHGHDQRPQFETLPEFGSGEFLFIYK